VEVNDQDYYTSLLNLTKFSIDDKFSKLGKNTDLLDYVHKNNWTLMANAENIFFENKISE